MGNKLGRRRQVVDEKYTRPQGLYQHRDMDYKKLRKLILDSKLAPCYPGDDEGATDFEECPICFLYYPSLNRSRCCMKRICTECFLQMKPAHSTRPTQCPFCKTLNYAVEYRGVKSKEEKGMEQIEEQRVIEAKIRMQQRELQDEQERMIRKQEIASSSRLMTSDEVEYQDMPGSSVAVSPFRFPARGDEIIPFQASGALHATRYLSHSRQNRENEFDMDLEDIMVMEAIWLSIQENNTHTERVCDDSPSGPSVVEDCHTSPAVTTGESSSPSGGLACAIAALAERQQMGEGNSTSASGNVPRYDALPQSSGLSLSIGDERSAENYPSESSMEVLPDGRESVPREESGWAVDHVSEMEAGTSDASVDAVVDGRASVEVNEGGGDILQPPMVGVGSILPESFEEQMMLAMAVSLAEARARTSSQGLARQ
ncbi:hypothetical protein MRB53_026667 [Persea americana]|uniref:Uncharacterized protein n=1 Tax=Persea americana TaxID=3435 RepID=A0ACC2LIT3_PERAE|nr:hypothetical protein MRB53_026667 [Persea americana]